MPDSLCVWRLGEERRMVEVKGAGCSVVVRVAGEGVTAMRVLTKIAFFRTQAVLSCCFLAICLFQAELIRHHCPACLRESNTYSTFKQPWAGCWRGVGAFSAPPRCPWARCQTSTLLRMSVCGSFGTPTPLVHGFCFFIVFYKLKNNPPKLWDRQNFTHTIHSLHSRNPTNTYSFTHPSDCRLARAAL